MPSGHTLWGQKKKAILKVRAKLLNSARVWLNQQGFTEVQGPILRPATGEWAGHFEVNCSGKRAYLGQDLQPYADSFVASLGKVYTIAPSFRIEKVSTKRHLTEYWGIEVAAPECGLEGIIRVQEELVTYICHNLSECAEEELKFLSRNIKDLADVKTPFPRITYDEAIGILKDTESIFWGHPLNREREKKISSRFSQPFFVTDFPVSNERFFYKSNTQRSELTLSADLLAPEGYGEIGGGGELITDKNVLLEKMAEEEIDSADQEWYLGLRRLGAGPQSGFMIGVERFIMWLCKLEHIKEATAFPRTPDSIYP